jgi:membrane-associated phospholipid phosphatase
LDHFPSDIAVGFALGAIIGIVLPELHKSKLYKQLSIGMYDSPEATGLTLRFKFPAQLKGSFLSRWSRHTVK